LQRAEWIKYVAPFFNKELEANKKFADIKGSYDNITAAVKKSPTTPPKSVAWLAWSSYAGPGIVVYTTPFKDQFIKDAGGVPLTKAIVGAFPGMEATGDNWKYNYTANGLTTNIADLLKDVDVIIDETYMLSNLTDWKNKMNLPATGPTGIKAVDSGDVYAITGSRGPAINAGGEYGNDWFETAVVRPDLVLKDITSVVSPDAVPAGHELKFLLKLDDNDTPTIIKADACKLFEACEKRPQPVAICPNIYRECATGKLMQAKPEDRCSAATDCPAVTADDAAAATTAPKNSAGVPMVNKVLFALAAAAVVPALLL